MCSSHETDISAHIHPAQPSSMSMPPTQERRSPRSQTTRQIHTLCICKYGEVKSVIQCQPQRIRGPSTCKPAHQTPDYLKGKNKTTKRRKNRGGGGGGMLRGAYSLVARLNHLTILTTHPFRDGAPFLLIIYRGWGWKKRGEQDRRGVERGTQEEQKNTTN